MNIAFLAPLLLLLAMAVPVLWLLPGRRRPMVLLSLRSLILLLIAVAAARPVAFRETRATWQVVVLDVSASVGEETREAAREAARRLVARLPSSTHTTLVTLGPRGAAADRAFAFADRHVHVAEPASASPLGTALAAAARSIPASARAAVTLLSDGLATDRSWGPALQDLSARGIPLHTIALPGAARAAALVHLALPETLRVGAVARVRAELVGFETAVRVQLLGPGEILATSPVVALDGRAFVELAFEPKQAGFLPLTARLELVEGEDADTRDDVLRRTAAVQPALSVLYLGHRLVEGRARLETLVGRGLALSAPPQGEALEPAHLAGVDLVVLDDRPADTLSPAMQRAIGEAVTEGRSGLLMCGGRAAFGAGGYQRTPLAALLPVELVQKEEKRDPSTTLVIIIDTSGSMGGNRVQLAKEVARLALRRLLPHDKVGIVEFYGAKRWAAPIQPASNAIEIQRALNRLNAGGGTVIMPAIEEAFYGLQNVRTRYKHVLVLTDGGVEQGAFEPLIRRMADKGITTSTVLIGPDAHSEFLVTIANWGKGRFYSVPNRFNLPEVLLKQPASAHLPSWRPGRHAVRARGGPGWWDGIDRASVPPLSGYVESRTRPGAAVLLEVAATQHPVLTTWRYGLGRVSALLTEPTGPGTKPWESWADYGAWLARLMARTASDTCETFAFDLERRGRTLTLTARALRPGSQRPAARLSGGRALAFRERAPGLFEARFEVPAIEEARVLAGVAGAGQGLSTHLVAGVNEGVSPELQVDPRRGLDLGHLARATGGRALALPQAEAFQPAAGGAETPLGISPLWPLLLLAALLLYLVELFWRRWPRAARVGGPR